MITLEQEIEELRAESRYCDPKERRQIERELKAAREELARFLAQVPHIEGGTSLPPSLPLPIPSGRRSVIFRPSPLSPPPFPGGGVRYCWTLPAAMKQAYRSIERQSRML
ncbi:hypothetical protein [Telmatospirillum sp.]|uniref:hypothetical protein n=1 Tax=Telmatospirillum sp. TaxID=2079197 RepID=UPI00284F59C1|nr:hypothetical protein [Telmatospirillum sp.]MDR3437343.1 hypothetical protein [Telmatospirillum sp.]